MSPKGRRSAPSLPLALYRGETRQPLRVAGLSGSGALSLVLFLVLAVGCGANSESATSANDDRSQGTKTYSQSQSEPEPAASPAPNKIRKKQEPQSIPGMNADAVLATFLRPGLECQPRVARGVLYACSSEENHNLTLLYEGEITGRSTDRVSGVEARVFRRGPEDFELASQPFFGLLATQLEYRGADRKRAYKFVNHNLSSEKATATIGTASWTIETSDDSKALEVAPAR